MNTKEIIEQANKTVKNTFEKVKRKAILAAPAFAMLLPAGGAIACYFECAAQSYFAVDQANRAFKQAGYARADSEQELEDVVEVLRDLDDNFIPEYDGYYGWGDEQFRALRETAEMMGCKDLEELKSLINKNPELEENMRALYKDNLIDATLEIQHERDYSDNIFDGHYADSNWHYFEENVAGAGEALDSALFNGGVGVALTAATMAVSIALSKRQHKKAQKLEQEAKAMNTKKSDPEMEM